MTILITTSCAIFLLIVGLALVVQNNQSKGLIGIMFALGLMTWSAATYASETWQCNVDNGDIVCTLPPDNPNVLMVIEYRGYLTITKTNKKTCEKVNEYLKEYQEQSRVWCIPEEEQ